MFVCFVFVRVHVCLPAESMHVHVCVYIDIFVFVSLHLCW